MEAETKSKIEEYIRKHRASGGRANEGADDAKEDLKSKPTRRNNAPEVEGEAEAMKAKKGGMVKKEGGKAEGKEARHHAGRKRRASGGGCEAHPFTTAKGRA